MQRAVLLSAASSLLKNVAGALCIKWEFSRNGKRCFQHIRLRSKTNDTNALWITCPSLFFFDVWLKVRWPVQESIFKQLQRIYAFYIEIKTNRGQKKSCAVCLYFAGCTFNHRPMLSLTMSSGKQIKFAARKGHKWRRRHRRSPTRLRTQTAWNKAAGREDVFKHANPKLAYIHFGLCV
jgi:hypothetical protein